MLNSLVAATKLHKYRVTRWTAEWTYCFIRYTVTKCNNCFTLATLSNFLYEYGDLLIYMYMAVGNNRSQITTANRQREWWNFTVVKNHRSRRLIGRKMFFTWRKFIVQRFDWLDSLWRIIKLQTRSFNIPSKLVKRNRMHSQNHQVISMFKWIQSPIELHSRIVFDTSV